jgi:oxygen-independent coproporphyrinogen-3 oxidase
MRQLGELASLGLLQCCSTAYVGGGTPSLMGADLMRSLVGSIYEHAPRVRELTCEANPDSLDDALLESLCASQATRISIGVQSFFDDELISLGRLHDSHRAIERVSSAVASGLDVSIDLMCATPLQTARSWQDTLLQATDLGVSHVSVYPLEIEPNTPLGKRYASQETPWNDEDVQASRMEAAYQMLSSAGYKRYEVASYAMAGKQCAHNKAYWTGIPYVGVGHAAAGMLDRNSYDLLRRIATRLPILAGDVARVRYRITSPWESIVQNPALDAMRMNLEFLDESQTLAEDLMLGMRLCAGLGADLLERAQDTFGDDFSRAVDGLVQDGLVDRRANRLMPTKRGWLLGNEIYAALWSLAPATTREAEV